MSRFLHRTTKQFVPSGNDPDYPAIDWIFSPDLSAVAGFPSKYWIITGDVISLMDQAARDAVDAQQVNDSRDEMANQLDFVEDVLRAFALVVLDEINTLRAEHSLTGRTIAQLKTGVRNKLGS